MTSFDVDSTLASLAARLEAQVAVLRELRDLSLQQRDVVAAGALASLQPLIEAREGAMARFQSIEAEAAPLRGSLSRHEAAARTRPALAAVTALRATAAALVQDILGRDRETLEAAQAARQARQQVLQGLDAGSTTLAAYRRSIATSSTAIVVSQRA